MTDIFDFDRVSTLFAVMGNPVGHSKSPQIHQAFAEQFGLHIDYQRIQVDVGGFPQAVRNFQASGGRGLNITLPFKLEARQLADELTPRALVAGAVNTIWFEQQLIFGDNTDGVGLVRDITDNLDCTIESADVLILGAGGAVRGVLGPLLQLQPATVVVANRTADKAIALAAGFAAGGNVTGCGFDRLQRGAFDIVINGTAASLDGEIPPLPDDLFADGALAYDLMYAEQPTVFMRWAHDRGAARTTDGLGMLVEQAAESFVGWHQLRPQTASVIRSLR